MRGLEHLRNQKSKQRLPIEARKWFPLRGSADSSTTRSRDASGYSLPPPSPKTPTAGGFDGKTHASPSNGSEASHLKGVKALEVRFAAPLPSLPSSSFLPEFASAAVPIGLLKWDQSGDEATALLLAPCFPTTSHKPVHSAPPARRNVRSEPASIAPPADTTRRFRWLSASQNTLDRTG